MTRSAAIAHHERAGRVEAVRLGVRVGGVDGVARQGEATAAGGGRCLPLTSAAFTGGESRLGALSLEVSVTASGAVAGIETAVRNTGAEPLWVESVVLGFRWRGAGSGALRFFQNGWQSWSATGSRALDDAGEPAFPSGPWLRGLHHAVSEPPEDRAGWHESHLVTVAGASPAGPACCVGALERGRVFAVVYLRRAGADVSLEVELRLEARLAPGERRALERVRVALGEEASALLEDFASEHGREAGARAAAPFLPGWCSWYHYFGSVTEADLLRNLEALSAARSEIPVEVVQLDDGWQRAVGDWLDTNARFPRGLPGVAEAIRAAGFTPGLWTAPFCAVEASATFALHPDWLLRSGDGFHRGLFHPDWSRDGSVYVLDPSRAEVVAHLEALFRELVARGFLYLKLDFLYAAAMQARAHDPALGRAERLRRGLEAIRRGAGDEAFVLGCGCPLGPAVGIVDAMRIGPDVAPRWRVDPAQAVRGIEATQPAARSALRSALARVWTHRRLWINDPDCLLAGEGTALSDAQARSLAAAIAATGGLFVLSDDVAALSPARRALAAETLALARRVDGLGVPGAARARDLLAEEIPTALVAASTQAAVAGLWNTDDAPRRLDLAAAPASEPPVAQLGTRLPRRPGGDRFEVELDPGESSCFRVRHPVALAVFCDFDGTFSVQDVGATLAQRHAGARRPLVWARYERGEITAWQYNLEVLGGLALPRAQVERFLATVELDPGARALVDWCAAHAVAFRVLSDGFDANLNRLQQLHGVRFAYDANALRYEHGRWSIRAMHPNPACGCGTGTCKAGRIDAFRAHRPGVPTVHIGNGRVSDLCGALAADVAFAKDSLGEELAARGRPFEPFRTLLDVIPRLEALLASRARLAGT
jgi:alpha-galactosidase